MSSPAQELEWKPCVYICVHTIKLIGYSRRKSNICYSNTVQYTHLLFTNSVVVPDVTVGVVGGRSVWEGKRECSVGFTDTE